MKKIFLCTLLFVLVHCVNAQVEVNFPKKGKRQLQEIRKPKLQDINGLWEGQISQISWDGQPEFNGTTGKLHVEINQKGPNIDGLLVCRAKFADGKGYLSYEKKFSGIWNGEILTYQDVAVENYINTHKELRHLETCLKNAELQFFQTKGKFHLEGEWKGSGHVTGIDCVPGKIQLTKVNPDDLALEYANTVNINFEQENGKPVELKWNEDENTIKKIKDRKVEKGKIIEVESRILSITVYDHKKDDGDIISLNYNGYWLLEKYRIDNDEHKIDVVLKSDGMNPDYVLLYAHNLGKYPPNTVALIINDGSTQQRVILNSDMHVCDVIYFRLKK